MTNEKRAQSKMQEQLEIFTELTGSQELSEAALEAISGGQVAKEDYFPYVQNPYGWHHVGSGLPVKRDHNKRYNHSILWPRVNYRDGNITWTRKEDSDARGIPYSGDSTHY